MIEYAQPVFAVLIEYVGRWLLEVKPYMVGMLREMMGRTLTFLLNITGEKFKIQSDESFSAVYSYIPKNAQFCIINFMG